MEELETQGTTTEKLVMLSYDEEQKKLASEQSEEPTE